MNLDTADMQGIRQGTATADMQGTRQGTATAAIHGSERYFHVENLLLDERLEF
jgi:hypothetical protein